MSCFTEINSVGRNICISSLPNIKGVEIYFRCFYFTYFTGWLNLKEKPLKTFKEEEKEEAVWFSSSLPDHQQVTGVLTI